MYYRPHNKKELFNLRHTSARNVIEQIFGVLKHKFRILQLVPEYSIDIQTQIPVALAAIYNFIHNQQPEEDGKDGNEDEDDQLIGGGVDVDDDEAEQNEGLDEDNERDQIAGEMWAQYLAEHVRCGVSLSEVDM